MKVQGGRIFGSLEGFIERMVSVCAMATYMVRSALVDQELTSKHLDDAWSLKS